MKKWLVLGIFLAGIFSNTGMNKMNINAQEILNIGTNPIGSGFHIIGVGISRIVEKYTQLKMKVIPMDAAHVFIPRMATKEIDLGIASNWNAEKAYFGESIYKELSKGEGFPVNLLCVIQQIKISAVVAGSSDITKISDLKGKRVAGPIPNPAIQLQTEAILANGGLKWSDIKPVPVKSVTEGVKAVIEGRADAAMVALGTPVVEELQAKKGARFLPIDPSPEAVKRTAEVFPGYPVKVVPRPGLTGIEKEQYLWAFDVYLIVREDLPESIVYEITKTLWEHCDELSAVHADLKDLQPTMFVSRNTLIPYHPGAIKLYKEKGVWTKDMEELQKILLSKKQK